MSWHGLSTIATVFLATNTSSKNVAQGAEWMTDYRQAARLRMGLSRRCAAGGVGQETLAALSYGVGDKAPGKAPLNIGQGIRSCRMTERATATSQLVLQLWEAILWELLTFGRKLRLNEWHKDRGSRPCCAGPGDRKNSLESIDSTLQAYDAGNVDITLLSVFLARPKGISSATKRCLNRSRQRRRDFVASQAPTSIVR